MQLSKRSERSTQRANESKVFRRIAKVQWKYSRADSLLESQRQLLKPLQRARPRNVLPQRRESSGYIWSADPDSGKFQPAVIQKKECAKSTQAVNPRGTENRFFQSRGWSAKVFYQQCSQNSTKTQFPRRAQKIRNEVR